MGLSIAELIDQELKGEVSRPDGSGSSLESFLLQSMRGSGSNMIRSIDALPCDLKTTSHVLTTTVMVRSEL